MSTETDSKAYDDLLDSIVKDKGQETAPDSLMDQALDNGEDNTDIIRKAHKNGIDEDDPVWILVKVFKDAADFQAQTMALLEKIRSHAKDDARIELENAAHAAFKDGLMALRATFEKERKTTALEFAKIDVGEVKQRKQRSAMSPMLMICAGIIVGVSLTLMSSVFYSGGLYQAGDTITNNGKVYVEVNKL